VWLMMAGIESGKAPLGSFPGFPCGLVDNETIRTGAHHPGIERPDSFEQNHPARIFI